MADVFLSYKREDSARVGKLVAALRSDGLDVWWDEDIPASAPWEATIEKALAEAKAVIVCWSPASIASENVRSEARVAREDGRLIQVFLKPCQPPLFFGERQGIDLTGWRGNAGDPRLVKLAQTVRSVMAGETLEHIDRPRRRSAAGFTPTLAAIVSLLLVMVAAAVGWWSLSPDKASDTTTLAVLPFRALDPEDANLVDAIWDDKRGAISRNPNLRVIGRVAMKALADDDLDPSDYRRKLGADYLLDGSVQRQDDKVRIKVSLVRTEDAAEVWSDHIGGKLDDVFDFQTRIASEVEGRIRGRVAPGGGVKMRNIATSGEVYAIFAQARAKVRQREATAVEEGKALLRKALAADPNYAPAWAELGVATGLGANEEQVAEAVSYLNRALQLAPNLAHAHAALAMVQSFPPESEPHVRKALALDPSDAEAWMWLGNYMLFQNRLAEAVEAHSRAAQLDPLWFPPVGNTLNDLGMLNDREGIAREIARVAAIGEPVLLAKTRALAAAAQNRPADELRILFELSAKHPEEAAWASRHMGSSLMQLGYVEEALRMWGWPADLAGNYRGIPDPAAKIRAEFPRPIDFWRAGDVPFVFARLLPKHGRLAEYVGYYTAAFESPDAAAEAFAKNPDLFTVLAPNLATNLRAAGRAGNADALLRRAERRLAESLRRGPATADHLFTMAMVRAARRRDDEAVALLRRAADRGWLPDRRQTAIDIADEPAFAGLAKRPDFQSIRRGILARIERERRSFEPAVPALAA